MEKVLLSGDLPTMLRRAVIYPSPDRLGEREESRFIPDTSGYKKKVIHKEKRVKIIFNKSRRPRVRCGGLGPGRIDTAVRRRPRRAPDRDRQRRERLRRRPRVQRRRGEEAAEGSQTEG